MNKKTIRDIDLAGKTVLVRVDYNVPINDGEVGDTLRLEASFPTLRYLVDQKCKIVLISHLGRPEGKADPSLSLALVAQKVTQLLNLPVKFVPESVGPEVEQAVTELQPTEILLLENLRFHPEEEANDAEFAKQLASLAAVFVQDGFAVVHRAHASTEAITKYLPSVMGLLVEKEVETITNALEQPQPPLLVVIGGAKVSDKIEVITNLLGHAQTLVIGGAMANTFLAAQGKSIGKSKHEAEAIETAKQVMAQAKEKEVALILPSEVVVTGEIAAGASTRTVGVDEVGENDIIADAGMSSMASLEQSISEAGTIIWNGPLGITEYEEFSGGSRRLAELIIGSKAKNIIGGGDTAAFIDALGWHDKFDLVSTGGGASLDLMAGKKLPGVEALQDKQLEKH